MLWLPLSAACLPIFLMSLGTAIYIPYQLGPARMCKYFTAVFTEEKSEDNILFTNRVTTFMLLLNIAVKVPVYGLCWFQLDELLYPDYHNIKEPVFFLTAPRNGSTQLCQYQEDDKENFIIPTAGEGLFPYIWFWKLFIPMFS